MARILIIEDNEMNLEMVKFLFEAAGHECFTAKDGLSGIDAAREQSPDLIVCDIQLPYMDGYTLARTLKTESQFKELPLVAVSSYAMVGDREQAVAAGFDGYLSKPIKPETFVQDVMKFAERAH